VTFSGNTKVGKLDFGDGESADGLPATHVYAKSGTFTAKFVANGKTASATVTATSPPEPTPKPPASFRVIIVFESGDNLTTAQRAVLDGKVVQDWLTANCTGGVAGWRRRDKDAPGDQDKTMSALWSAVKPKVTSTPCFAIACDDKVTLEPFPPTPAAAVALLTKYKEGR
jgi:hypothetical protein